MQRVADTRANRNENILAAVKCIGRSKDRRAVFEAVYKGKKEVKRVDEIAQATGLAEKRVLERGKELAHEGIVKQVKSNGKNGLQKKTPFILPIKSVCCP